MNWNPLTSKYYTAIMTSLVAFFGLGEDATEAEVHNAVSEMGTLASIKQEAIASATAAVNSQLESLQSKITALESASAQAQSEGAGTAEKLEALETSVATMQAQITEKDATIASQKEQIANLSAEVAALKVGGSVVKGGAVADEGLPIKEASKTQSNHVVIDQTAMREMFGL